MSSQVQNQEYSGGHGELEVLMSSKGDCPQLNYHGKCAICT